MTVLLVAMLLVLSAQPAAAAEAPSACTDHAAVSWRVDIAANTVEEARVEVAGCADGSVVGLQVITSGVDVPAEPLLDTVAEEVAVFDLRAYDVDIEATTGVRVQFFGDAGAPTDPSQPGDPTLPVGEDEVPDDGGEDPDTPIVDAPGPVEGDGDVDGGGDDRDPVNPPVDQPQPGDGATPDDGVSDDEVSGAGDGGGSGGSGDRLARTGTDLLSTTVGGFLVMAAGLLLLERRRRVGFRA